MNGPVKSLSGILLRVKRAGEGGRVAVMLSKEEGRQNLYVSRGVLQACGAGGMLPFAEVTAQIRSGEGISFVSQYDSRILLNLMAVPYEEMEQWYFLAELMMALFPEGTGDAAVLSILKKALLLAEQRNRTIIAFMAAVQVLTRAGYDLCQKEPAEKLKLSSGGRSLLKAFQQYPWQGALGKAVKESTFRECARYMEAFLELYCDLRLQTRGAFLKKNHT